MEHFEACMLVNQVEYTMYIEDSDSESSDDTDCFIMVMFNRNPHELPFKILKFE